MPIQVCCPFFLLGYFSFSYWLIGICIFWISGLCQLKISFPTWQLVACIFLGGREQRHKCLLPLNSFAYCLGTLGSLLSLHGQWLPFLMQLRVSVPTSSGLAVPSRGKLPRNQGSPCKKNNVSLVLYFLFSCFLSNNRENEILALSQPHKPLLHTSVPKRIK